MSLAYLVWGCLTALISCLVTRNLCSTASFFYLPDHPNKRSLHVAPTPRTGGLAIFFSVVVVLSIIFILKLFYFSMQFDLDKIQTGSFFWLGVGIFFVAGVSFWDDRRGLLSGVRLFFHLWTASILVLGAGLLLEKISVPFVGNVSLNPIIAIPLTVLFLTWMANLYNFMDGMDGFAGGMTLFGFSFFGIIFWVHGNTSIAIISFLISGSMGGFLAHNFPPAKIFMGDIGSIPLGFLAGAFSILGVRNRAFDIWVPLLIFSPFIVDATATLFLRIKSGQKIWEAHREHYYQRLVLMGWGHKKTVLSEYVLMLACGLSAVLYLQLSDVLRFFLLLSWFVIYVFLGRTINVLEKRHLKHAK